MKYVKILFAIFLDEKLGECYMKISNERLENLRLEYLRKAEEKRQAILELCSNDEYISWLRRFMEVHTEFKSNDWSLQTLESTGKDRENVAQLGYLYEGIELYAESQDDIYPKPCSYGNYYSLIYHNDGYQLGRITNTTSTAYCCKRLKTNQVLSPIDFSDVIDYSIEKLSSKTYQKVR